MSNAVTNAYVGGEGAAGIRVLAQHIARVPKEFQAALRPKIRAAGMVVLREAAMNASWSTRIPGAMSVRTTFKDGMPGVSIVVNVKKAPHARALEGIVSDHFRHPVFGNENHWVEQSARPYLLPAARASYSVLAGAISDAVDEALKTNGLG